MRFINAIRAFIIILFLGCCVQQSSGFSLALDSIATWGKFPKFCIDVYRWGDNFFNGYDTAYVVGTGYKFNGKVKVNSWIDMYHFYLPENVRMSAVSDPSTSIGGWLTYLAVSAGYDKNVSRFFGSNNVKTREEFTFGFNCSLFAFNMSFNNNTGGVKIKKFGTPSNSINPNIEFDGLKSKYFGFDAYYFFNHKKYSQAAAFNFSRIQIKSQGSWFAGLSYSNQQFNFDFNDLPEFITSALPTSWLYHRYEANTKNLAIKVGYGYNWVFAPKWVLGVSESPSIGLKRGVINNPDKETTNLTFSNQFRISVVWNHKQWFAGVIGEVNQALIYEKGSAFQNLVTNGSMIVGYRFNIW